MSFLAYVAEIRPFFILTVGGYFAGLLDGVLITVVVLVVVFYYKSGCCN